MSSFVTFQPFNFAMACMPKTIAFVHGDIVPFLPPFHQSGLRVDIVTEGAEKKGKG